MFFWFNTTVIAYWKHLSLFFRFIAVFITYQKNLFIHHDLNLFNYIYNSFRLSYQNQNRCFSLTYLVINIGLPSSYLVKRISKSTLTISSVLLPPMMVILLLFEWAHCLSSSSSFDGIKLTFIVKWIFHSPDFLSSSIIVPKYVLRYSSIDTFPPLFYIQYVSH